MADRAPTTFPTTPDEPGRLEALRSYGILDTLPERDFDDLTRIAAKVCDAPIALVNLIDEERGWFKAKVGLDALEVPRGDAMCSWAITEPDGAFVVEDLTQDERFEDNPLVAGDPDLRFYAGASLVTADGHALGTLCVLDRTPRRLGKEEVEALEALARQVVRLLEARRQVLELEEAIRQRRTAEAEMLRAREQAETASRAKTELLSRVSHELRTPLNAILGFADLLSTDDRLDPALREDVDAILDAGRHLLEMVDGVLAISRVDGDASSLKLGPVDVRRAAEEVVTLARPLADAASVAFEAGVCSDIVMGDGDALVRILSALVSNAITYNRAGGRVQLESSTDGDEVRIAVRDDGPGVAPDDVPRLFTAFDRLGAEHTTVAGTGLGLPLARHLLELMGGRIEVETAPGAGSTFTAVLPLAVGEREA